MGYGPAHVLESGLLPRFLSRLKAWEADIGLYPNDLGNHSLRRGLASDWALRGVPDRLRRAHGRWHSA